MLAPKDTEVIWRIQFCSIWSRGMTQCKARGDSVSICNPRTRWGGGDRRPLSTLHASWPGLRSYEQQNDGRQGLILEVLESHMCPLNT